jgi:hypothetical protein
MSQKLTFSQKMAARQFRKYRAEYYEDLASLLSTTNRKMLSIFEVDAQRYANTPRGQLSSVWAQRFIDNGADLAKTWQGTLPADEMAILQVQQDAGEDSVPSALIDLAAIARLVDQVVSEATGTLTAGFISLLFASVAITVMPGFAVAALQDAIEIPLSYWGPFGQAMATWAVTVKTYLVPMMIALGSALTWLVWSLQNWTGKARETADKSILLYRTLRDISAARFLLTMSSVTRKQGNVMHTLEEALTNLADSSVSPWTRWRIEQVLMRIEQSGATNCDVFDTGILSDEMFWRLRDIEEGKGFSQAFEVTGKYVSLAIVPRLIKRLMFWRWALLLLGVFVTGGMVFWIQTASYEMKAAAMNYMTQ